MAAVTCVGCGRDTSLRMSGRKCRCAVREYHGDDVPALPARAVRARGGAGIPCAAVGAGRRHQPTQLPRLRRAHTQPLCLSFCHRPPRASFLCLSVSFHSLLRSSGRLREVAVQVN